LTIDSNSLSLGGLTAVVGNDVPEGGSVVSDSFALQGTEDFASGAFAPQVLVLLRVANTGISTSGPLTSTALPTALTGFAYQEVLFNDDNTGGTITSLTQVAAPEPSGFLLGLTGLGAAALLARRRSVRGRESGRPGLPCD
jgi:MYXO-CTERM domain-containing protein